MPSVESYPSRRSTFLGEHFSESRRPSSWLLSGSNLLSSTLNGGNPLAQTAQVGLHQPLGFLLYSGQFWCHDENVNAIQNLSRNVLS